MKRHIFLLVMTGMPLAFFAQEQRVNAFDHMLQRVKIWKSFENKRVGDHLFLEGGAGMTMTAYRRGTDSRIPFGTPGANLNVAVGDWITPEHGVRLGFRGGAMKTSKYSCFGGLSADYLLNFTALAKPTYEEPRRLEFYGVAGLNAFGVRNEGKNELAWGAHLGLRGQLGLSDYTYIYMEPQIGVYSDKLYSENHWRKFRPTASLDVGFGYRLLGTGRKTGEEYVSQSFFDDMFVSLSAGPSALLCKPFGKYKDHLGARSAVSLGKWFDPYYGVRLNLEATVNRQLPRRKNKAVGIGADYLLNLHSLFGGYNPARRFSISALAGANLSVSKSHGASRQTSLGVVGGLQGNVRLSENLALFVEPRVDVHQEKYAQYSPSVAGWVVMPSCMLGVTLRNGVGHADGEVRESQEFKADNWSDHIFWEGAMGLWMPVANTTVRHPNDYLQPNVHMGIGKWFTASSGLRAWGEAGHLKHRQGKHGRMGAVTFGADYLWNITNTLNGYYEDRKLELLGVVGPNLSYSYRTKRVYLGATVGAQGVWNLNKMWGLFLEPQVKVYNSKYVTRAKNVFHLDLVTSMSAGVRINVGGQLGRGTSQFDEDETRDEWFATGAAGASVHLPYMRTACFYGPAWRVGVGHWMNPIAAWRVNVTTRTQKGRDKRFWRCAAGLDYLLDISALSYGYNPKRAVSMGVLGGVDLGIDHIKDNSAVFAPDVHVGGDLTFRVNDELALYVEPQLAYQFKRSRSSKLSSFSPSLLVGFNYTIPWKLIKVVRK